MKGRTFILNASTLIALFPLLAIAKALDWSRGFYSFLSLGWLTAGAVVFLGWQVFRDRLWPRAKASGAEEIFWKAALLLGVWESYRGFRYPRVINAVDGPWKDTVIPVFLLFSLVLGLFAWSALITGRKRSRLADWIVPSLAAASVLQLLARAAVLWASPAPGIDVFTIANEAVGFLSQGLNPYAQVYPDIYSGLFQYVPRLSYPPGYFDLIIITKKLGLDIRWSSVAAEGFAAVGIWKIAEARALPNVARWISAFVFLAFPLALHTVEQAWVDVILVPFGIWALWFCMRGYWAWAGALLGYALTVKQYAAAAAFFAFMGIWAQVGRAAALRLAAGGVATVFFVLLPWLIWDAHALYVGTVENFLQMPPRKDALSWFAHFIRKDQAPPAALLIIVPLVSFVGALWISLRKKTGATDWMFGTAFFFLGTFMVSKQAFCNYYTLIAAWYWAALVSRSALKGS